MKIRINCFKAIMASIAALFATTAPSAAATHTSVRHPEWSRNAVIYEVNWRQMTENGTLPELTRQLPRLKDLGVDILWLMPVHPISELNRKGELGSYYAVQNYRDVNPELGSVDEMKEFIDRAHKIGFKVIIDWVPNHTGCDHSWVTEHPEYYARNEQGEMYGPFDWTDVYKLDYTNPGTRDAMTEDMKWWLTEMGIDGFRCDVAMQVPTEFWNMVRPQLQAVKSDLFMLAEASQPDLEAHCFDMAYNWPMKDLFNAIAATSGEYRYDPSHKFESKHASDIPVLVKEQEREYPADSYMMNMITNHDLNSWEGTEFDRYGKLTRAMAVLTYTLPGMPLIYTGQEAGMQKAFEFFKKDTPPVWEHGHEYADFYRRLNHIKHTEDSLRAGKEGAPMITYKTTSDDVLVYSRGELLTVVNLGADERPLIIDDSEPSHGEKGWIDMLTDKKYDRLPATLKSGEALLLKPVK